MSNKTHFFMTLAALFFLGIIVSKPKGIDFYSEQSEERSCKLLKGKMDCAHRYGDSRIKDTAGLVRYQYN